MGRTLAVGRRRNRRDQLFGTLPRWAVLSATSMGARRTEVVGKHNFFALLKAALASKVQFSLAYYVTICLTLISNPFTQPPNTLLATRTLIMLERD